MPSNSGPPAASRATRLARISSLTERACQPEPRRSPMVAGRDEGSGEDERTTAGTPGCVRDGSGRPAWPPPPNASNAVPRPRVPSGPLPALWLHDAAGDAQHADLRRLLALELEGRAADARAEVRDHRPREVVEAVLGHVPRRQHRVREPLQVAVLVACERADVVRGGDPRTRGSLRDGQNHAEA